MKAIMNYKTLSLLALLSISAVTLAACLQGEAKEPIVDKGSWWTDGSNYYEVKVSDNKKVKLEGFTLHEGGLAVELDVKGDALTVADADFSPFAKPGDKVELQTITNSKGKPLELLIAYRDGQPVAALQHFDGKELAYEKSAIQAVIAGKYADADNPKTVWTFYPNGTVSLGTGKKAQPYKIELVYHTPSTILTLPDGSHAGLFFNEGFDGEIERLNFSRATYDKEEDEWNGGDEIYAMMVRQEPNEWYKEMLFSNCVANYYSISGVESLIPELRKSDSELAKLNASLMEEWLKDDE